MYKALARAILGMGITGAILVYSVALLFNPPIGNTLKVILADSTIAFIIFAISALTLRKRLN